jgi:ATP-dependent DNA helicase RecQ
MRKATLQSCIDQLVDAQALAREEGEYPTLRFTPSSIEVLRGKAPITLVRPRGADDRRESRRAGSMVEGKGSALGDADRELFEALRLLRRAIADEMNVPPYIVCGDATLEQIAKTRPTTEAQLMQVKGIGRRKLEQFGERFLSHVREHAPEPSYRAPRASKGS